MGELIEIVFENVEKHALASFVMELADYGKTVKNYHVLSGHGQADWQNYGSVLNTIEKLTGGSLFVNLVSLDMGNITLSHCALRVIQYDDKFDLEISVDSEDVRLYEYMLPRFAMEMAEKYHVENFYGGIEPATDEDTRIFTCDRPGPLFPDQLKPVAIQADEVPAAMSA